MRTPHHRLTAPCLTLVCLGLPALSSPSLAQQTLFVRQSGSDAADGHTGATALRTVTKALAVATAGDRVYVGAGTYAGGLAPSRTGTAASPIQIFADTDGTKTGDAGPVVISASGTPVLTIKTTDHLYFTGFTFVGGVDGVSIENSSGVRLVSCTLRGMSDSGVTVKNTTGQGSVLIDKCVIASGGGRGILINQNASVTLQDSWLSSLASSAVVLAWPNSTLDLTRCGIDTVTGFGVDIDRGIATVSNLLVRGCTQGGVRLGTHSSVNLKLVNATVVPGAGKGIFQEGGILAMHNSIIASATDGLNRAGGTATHSFNLYFGCTNNYVGVPPGASDLLVDPLFTSAVDLHPLASSPAIDSGTDMSPITVTDLDRKPRPLNKVFDRGCYEFGTAPTLRIIKWEETEPE